MIIMNHEYGDLKQIKEKLGSIIYLHASIVQFRITYNAHGAKRAQHTFIRGPKTN